MQMSQTHQISLLHAIISIISLLWSVTFVVCAPDRLRLAKPNPRDDLIIPSLGVYDRWFFQAMTKIQDLGELDPKLLDAEKNRKFIKVSQKGDGHFKTITEAVDSIEENNTKRVIIEIDGGVYNEKITIKKSKPFVTLVGNFVNMPVLAQNLTTAQVNFTETATLTVEADYFQGGNLIIKNTYRPPTPATIMGAGIALRIQGDAAFFVNCTMEALMNTIRDEEGRHFFYDCTIWGDQYLISGDGRTIYLTTDFNVTNALPNCMVAVNERNITTDDSGGGFVFVLCHVRSYLDNPSPVYLGSPDGAGARIVYAYTKVTPHEVVSPQRFVPSYSHFEYSQTAFLGEYMDEEDMDHAVNLDRMVSFGKKLTKTEVSKYITLDYIQATKWLIPVHNYGYRDDHVLHPL